MKISYNGQNVFQNKTVKYLIPVLNANPEVARIINQGFYKLAVGIDDFLYHKKKGRYIFILVFNKHQPKLFESSLNNLRLQSSYIDDYPVNNNEHMLVISVAKEYSQTYDNFLKGRYSKMYNKNFILETFCKPHQEAYKNVLLRNEEAKWAFFKHLETDWNIQKPFELNVQEYEEPLKYEDEVFNYPNKKPIYIQINE